MKWTMFVERWPGASTVEESTTGDRLKAIASDIWKHAKHRGASKVRFTIYRPGGGEWQTCSREAGGSWRARWFWCRAVNSGELVKGRYTVRNALKEDKLGSLLEEEQAGDGESVRCTCDWANEENGSIGLLYPYVLDSDCAVHGAPNDFRPGDEYERMYAAPPPQTLPGDRERALETVLRSLEWSRTGLERHAWNGKGNAGWVDTCPCCHRKKSIGHTDGCRLSTALSSSVSTPEGSNT